MLIIEDNKKNHAIQVNACSSFLSDFDTTAYEALAYADTNDRCTDRRSFCPDLFYGFVPQHGPLLNNSSAQLLVRSTRCSSNVLTSFRFCLHTRCQHHREIKGGLVKIIMIISVSCVEGSSGTIYYGVLSIYRGQIFKVLPTTPSNRRPSAPARPSSANRKVCTGLPPLLRLM